MKILSTLLLTCALGLGVYTFSAVAAPAPADGGAVIGAQWFPVPDCTQCSGQSASVCPWGLGFTCAGGGIPVCIVGSGGTGACRPDGYRYCSGTAWQCASQGGDCQGY